MTFIVMDCLSNTVLAERNTKEEADQACARYGGNQKGYYVFEKKTDIIGQGLLF